MDPSPIAANAEATAANARPSPEPVGQATPRRRGRPSLLRPALTLLAVIALVIFGSRHPGSTSRPSSKPTALAAIVNGLPVPLADYKWQLAVATRAYAGPTAPPNSPTGRTISRLLRDQAVQEAIAETLIDKEALRHHMSVPSTAVNQAVAGLATRTGGSVGLAEQLKSTGMTMNDLRRVMRYMLLRDRLGKLLDDPAWLDHLVDQARITYYVGDGAAGPDAVPTILLGHPVPPFVALDLTGKAVSPADLRGRAVVLMFWATSCGDCQDQLVMLRQFAQAHSNVAVVAIDRGEDAGTVRRYLAAKHLNGLPVWMDKSAQASANYTVTSLPATFFIDKHGILRGYNFGPVSDINSLEIQARYAEHGINHTVT